MAATALPAAPVTTLKVHAPKRDWGAEISKVGSGEKPRIILAGKGGVGKTSMAAHATDPIFLMSPGETGVQTLIDAKQIGETPYLPVTQSWDEMLDALRWLLNGEHDRKSLCLDALNGFEKLCHAHVAARDYGGKMGKDGFSSYMQGYDVALTDWREFLALLDRIRIERRMAIIGLAHVAIRPYKNPLGDDFDRITPDMHQKTWGLTYAWADIVAFCDFFVITRKDGSRAKGSGGQQRMMYTEYSAGYDAKNRHGLPSEIDMGSSGKEAWDNFIAAIKAGRS